MKLVVMKFGGTSVASINKINNVANIVEKQLNDKKLIVVLSAMSGAVSYTHLTLPTTPYV